MVMQPAIAFWDGGSNPSRLTFTPPPPAKICGPGFEPPTKNFKSAVLPFDQQLCVSNQLPHCLEPSERKLLTPPPPPPTPPPRKSDIQF